MTTNADLSFTFDLEQNPNAGVSEGFDRSPLPAGDYSFVIEKAEVRRCYAGIFSTKEADLLQYETEHPDLVEGKTLDIVAKITEGPFVDRKMFWGKFDLCFTAPSDAKNFDGKNGKPFTVAQQTAVAVKNIHGLQTRLGIKGFNDPSELIGLTGVITVSIKGQYNKYHFPVQAAGKQKTAVVTGTIAHASSDATPF